MAFISIPLPTPFVNGNRYDYSAVQVQIDGMPILGQEITAITYKHTLKPEGIYGSSPVKIGRTRGRYEADGTLEINKEAYGTLISLLAQDPSLGYMEKSFTITVSYQDTGGPLITDTLIGCRLTEDEDSHKSGPEGLTVRCTLDIMTIERDGISPIGGILGGTI
jgi:hypothetical protein